MARKGLRLEGRGNNVETRIEISLKVTEGKN